MEIESVGTVILLENSRGNLSKPTEKEIAKYVSGAVTKLRSKGIAFELLEEYYAKLNKLIIFDTK